MRPIVLAPVLLLLAACASPREACLSGAARELRTVDALIAETRGNLARGYAVERGQVLREVPDFCFGDPDDGEIERCDRIDVRNVSRPVAIDPAAERAKLDGLLERRAALVAAYPAQAGACAAYPA